MDGQVQELIRSETTFNTTINQIVKQLLRPLKTQNADNEAIAAVFSNLEDIAAYSNVVLKLLNPTTSSAPLILEDSTWSQLFDTVYGRLGKQATSVMFVTYATSLNNAISLCQNNPETRQILTQFVLENQPAGFDKGDTPIRFVQHLLTLPIRHLLFLLHHLHSLTDATTPTLTSSNSNSNSVSNSNVTGRHDKVSKAYRLIKAVVYECVCILYPSSLTLVRLRLNAISSLPATRIHFTVPCIREDGQSGLLAAIDLNLIFFAPPTQPTSAPVNTKPRDIK
eukprot:c20355_g3_i3.p1 GENE.c20355_g3_i3~~c20355_g3_i3.p1  ORF type:complete len:281 (+),score=66.70 c20355_g3_i3:51-893(+)